MTIYYIHDLVEEALKNDPHTRDDDSLLYIKVCSRMNPITLKMDFETVMKHRADFGIPSFETVGRCRRRIQENNPHLRASEKATNGRYKRWKEVMDYVSD